MRYGTPPRPAHRATADGGLVLLVRGIGSGGQHRPPPAPPHSSLLRVALPQLRGRRVVAPPPRKRRVASPRPRVRRTTTRRRSAVEPQRAVLWLTQGIAGVILLGLALTIGFLVLASDRHQRQSVTPMAPATPARGEVFPGDELRPAGATGAYRIEVRHLDADCRTATTGKLGAVLVGRGCSEVVRAGITAPYGDYRVTAGVFTLSDAAGAAEVDDLVRGLVESGDGGFTSIPAVPGDSSTAQVGWRTRGNFLLYCVITRPGGQVVPADDPYAARITAELVDTHLGGSVLGHQAAPPQPPGVLAAS
ncbi:hypothetical protein [Paractinoplanes hotanensis]|uniref:Uncharacterized protein n=1 Tax=Paractinoplanes hotanensis TaxID=2906497 RepID=A0ABT0Y1A8_9ACTN|nr:hypothetical protein [Actinoplanes hotanensis]MCM4079814.1 hypothetical protein [Actinoplanes hotanensis]